MITIFTTAKPFRGPIELSQMNALRSWKALSPEVDIILFGDGEGYSRAANELGLCHIRDVETTEQGTPLFNSMWSLAKAHGRFPVQMYANCDVILLDDFLPAIKKIKFAKFLMVGQRWDLDLNKGIDFDDEDWSSELRSRIRTQGVLHPPTGSDFFVYRGDIWREIPVLVVGRAAYDNELIYHCRASRVPVIDVSDVVTVVHQNHDYGHHPLGETGVWQGDEAQVNRRSLRSPKYLFTLLDSDWRLKSNGIAKNHCRGDCERYFKSLSILSRKSGKRNIYDLCRFFVGKFRRAKSRMLRLFRVGVVNG